MNNIHSSDRIVSPDGGRTARRQYLPVAAIFLLALLLRLGFFGVYGVIPNGDSIAYTQLAANLAAGRGYSDRFAPPYDPHTLRIPGYPLFLAAHLVLDPQHGLGLAILTQIVLGATTCVLVYHIARRFLPPGGAGLASLLAAFNFVHIYLASCFLAEALSIFLLGVFILLAVHRGNWGRPWVAFAMGIILSMALFVRMPSAFLIPVYASAILPFAVPSVSRSRRFVVLLCFLLPIVSSTQLWCMRNYRATGHYGLTSLGGYYSLWRALRFGTVRPEAFTGKERLVAEVAEKNGVRMWLIADTLHNDYKFSYPEIAALFNQIARKSLKAHPWRYVRGCTYDLLNNFLSPAIPTRTLGFPPIGWTNAPRYMTENLREGNYGAVALNLLLRGTFALIFFLVMPLGGYVLWVRRPELRREQLLLWGFAFAVILAGTVLAGGSDRFRAPTDTIFVMFISAGVCELLGRKIGESESKTACPAELAKERY